jgi:hypothetical protein
MANTGRDNAAAYGKVVARAWRDPTFKAKLIADPHAVLKEAGVAVPAVDKVAGGAGPIPGKTGYWSGGASYG